MSFTPIVPGAGLAGWAYLDRTREDQQKVFDQSPSVARDIAYFKENIGRVKTADDLVGDYRLLKVALGAFGLGEDIQNRAFISKVLASDMDDPGSFANRLGDRRYRPFAEAFGFNTDGGPKLETRAMSEALAAKLPTVGSAEEVMADRRLLRDALAHVGLEEEIGNRYFLKRVLQSDLSDPASMANRAGDSRHVALAQMFDFRAKAKAAGDAMGFVDVFAAKTGVLEETVMDGITSADALMEDPRALRVAKGIFGLQGAEPEVLRQALTSDPADPDSFINSLADKRYLAMAQAFDFTGDPDAISPLEEFVEVIGDNRARIAEAGPDMLARREVRDAVERFFGVADQNRPTDFLRRVLASDTTSRTSLTSFHPDKRFEAMAGAFGFATPDTRPAFSSAFAEEITRRFSGRAFEASVGETAPDVRLALALDREITRIAERDMTTDGEWFTVIATDPLRRAFQTALQLPDSFAQLDIDDQVSRLKDRAQQMFGTDTVSGFAEPDRLAELRERFLTLSAVSGPSPGSGRESAALAILSGGGTGGTGGGATALSILAAGNAWRGFR